MQKTAVDLSNPDIKHLMKALSDLGLEPVKVSDRHIKFYGGAWQNGKLSVRGGTTASEIREHYARGIVSYAAKQFGWSLREKLTTKKGVVATFEAKKR